MINEHNVADLIGADLLDESGNKVGRIGQIFLDDQSGAPEWATVNTGLFGTKESFVPLNGATRDGNDLKVSFRKSQIKDAPSVDVDAGHLDESEEADLYRHYGLDYGQSGVDRDVDIDRDVDHDVDIDRDVDHDVAGTVGRDTSGPTTDQAMTRSEERLHVGTEKVATGKARLRKYVVTEEEQVSVPVTKEKLRIEREPITDANRGEALAGPDLSEEEHEVTLTEERVVVGKETVPVERVRVAKDVEQTEETVTEQVRKERIDADGDGDIDLRDDERRTSDLVDSDSDRR